MRLLISSDYRYRLTRDGSVWTDGPCHYSVWSRYRAVFDHVNVVARVRLADDVSPTWRRADGTGVSFSAVPPYSGPARYILRLPSILRSVRAAVGPADAVLLNVPGQIGTCVRSCLADGRPYGVQVLGDPYEVFAPGAVRHPARPFLRWWCSRRMRRQVESAAAALYVTRQSLQSRYVCPGPMVGASDAELTPEAFAASPRRPGRAPKPATLISVAALEQPYKGIDILIDAVALCADRGRDLRLVIVGDGRERPLLDRYSVRRGLAARVQFRGQLPAGTAIRRELDAADLFVLPSRTEGLPRALLEAMARGLPCVASAVGGIPELLAPEDSCPAGDAEALARRIAEFLDDPRRMAVASERNLCTARTYAEEILQPQRIAFLRDLAGMTEEWLARSRRKSAADKAMIPGGGP